MSSDFLELINKSIVNWNAERPLEYQFVWRCLLPLTLIPQKHRKEIKILDVGGAESNLSKTLAELDFDVTVIDINDVDHGKAKFVRENILMYDFPEQSFDIVIAISTIEHVGLQSYGQTKQEDYGDMITMEKIHKWLKSYGLAIITLPYGKPHHPPTFERVYDLTLLDDRILFGDWRIVEIQYICDKGEWDTCTEEEARNRDAAVLLLLQKKKHY